MPSTARGVLCRPSLGKFFSLLFLVSFVAVVVGATLWVASMVLVLVLQIRNVPLWFLVGFCLFLILVVVWQSIEVYREVFSMFYQGLMGACERLIAIIFAGSAEAFGVSQNLIAGFYGVICLMLVPGVAWITYKFRGAAPLEFLQSIIDGRVVWRGISAWVYFGAFSYFLMVFLVLSVSILLLVSRRFRSVLTRPQIKPLDHAKNDFSSMQWCRIAHLSDLHVMASGGKLAENPQRSVSIDGVEKIFSSLLNIDDLSAVVVSGDLTDSGDVASWNAILSCNSLSKLADRIVIAPGNHDLNPIETGFWSSLWGFADLQRNGQNLRALRYLQFANLLMGGRAEVICPYTQRLSKLSCVMARAQPDLIAWSKRSEVKGRLRKKSLTPRELLEKCFPMRVAVLDNEGKFLPSFFVWNSVSSTAWALLNAVGSIEDTQIERASKLIAACEDTALVHVMHHQLAQPNPKHLVSPKKRAYKDRLTSGWTVLMRAIPVISWIESLGQKTLILHGHKHKYFVAELMDGQATVVSAPSGTLGCEESFVKDFIQSEDGFWLNLKINVDGPHAMLSEMEVHKS
ncbi:hypothetical protein C8246_21490 [Paracidovorax avenae]|nr:hypothetical protein C8246_21490 [Paracidovorax avenae]